MPSKFKIKCKLSRGRVEYVNEIDNQSYLCLCKYSLNNDLYGFYRHLDEHIKETVKDFELLTIADKLFIYLSLYVYCIRPSIQIAAQSISDFSNNSTYDLFEVLDNFEWPEINEFSKTLNTKNGPAEVLIGIPKEFELVGDEYRFNPYSAIRELTINNIKYLVNSQEDFKTLELLLPTNSYNELLKILIKAYNTIIKIIPDKIELPILSNVTTRFIADKLYCTDPNNIFSAMYLLSHNLNITPTDYNSFSPLDSGILLDRLISEKKAEKEQAEAENNRNRNKGFREL